MTEAECIALKQQAFRKYFHSLNEQQQQAVFSVNGPVLVLAGAGSGKTYVLMKRFVQILRSDLSVNPTNIVAITFTRKAADEIKGRVLQAGG